MNNEPISHEELQGFLLLLNIERQKGFAEIEAKVPGWYQDRELICAEVGPKYVRIVVTHEDDKDPNFPAREVVTAEGTARRVVASAYCFIDKATGDILKPAGFKGPAKGIRGNIRSGDWWSERGDKALGPYGVRSLR